MYYKDDIPIKLRPDLNSLSECIVSEIKVNNKKCFIITLYRSPSQSIDEFENLLFSLEETLPKISYEKPYLSILTGDFNARSTIVNQIIIEPTHILENSSSCINLIFCSNSDLISNQSVHPSLCGNCHHQLIFGVFHFKIIYPKPYEQLVWDYKKADADMIKRSISMFPWKASFVDNNIDSCVQILNTSLQTFTIIYLIKR